MIESINNERIKNISKLNDKKYQDKENKYIIEGEHIIEEANKHGYLEEVFILEGYNYNYKNKTYVKDNVMRKLSSLSNIPKIVGVARKINRGTIKGRVLILDDISDPGNIGTIIRSAVAFNIDTLIISKNSVSIYNPKVLRATEGMIYSLNIIIDSLDNIMTKLKDNNYKIYVTDVKGGTSLSKINFDNKSAIVIGSEAKGVSEDIKKYADYKLYIDMNKNCESLNAGVSASIIMYELDKK